MGDKHIKNILSLNTQTICLGAILLMTQVHILQGFFILLCLIMLTISAQCITFNTQVRTLISREMILKKKKSSKDSIEAKGRKSIRKSNWLIVPSATKRSDMILTARS